MEGIAILRFQNRGHGNRGERYILTQPNMYARGILFGKMKYELGDHSFVRCPENGLAADIEFKTKGYFGGTYNAIVGVIKNEKSGEALFEISGMWSGEMIIKDMTTGKKETLFNATHAKHTAPVTRPLEEQEDRESQKLWYKTVQALKERNHEIATDEKTKIEDAQREEAAKRAEDGVEWHPRYFRRVRGGPGGSEEGEEDLDFILNAEIDGPTPNARTQQILAVAPIIQGQKVSTEFEVPKHHPRHAQKTSLPASGGNDLIDFGQNDAPAQSTKAPQPPAQFMQNQNASLAQPLEPRNDRPIQRVDSYTHELDQFVDAEEP